MAYQKPTIAKTALDEAREAFASRNKMPINWPEVQKAGEPDELLTEMAKEAVHMPAPEAPTVH
jgi:hypothetical protein